MGQRWFISSAFLVLGFLHFSNSLYADSLNLGLENGRENEVDSLLWENEEPSDFHQEPPEYDWKEKEEPKNDLIEEPVNKENEDYTKWLNVLTFDKLYNLTEKDLGPENETKLILINTEDHLKIFENEDKEDTDIQLHQDESKDNNIFRLLSPEGLLSEIKHEAQSTDLVRTKRQAENGKRRCRCRRKRRRNMVRRRRRRRRNRVGQQRPVRRRRRRRRRNGRRGRRRCVCRKKGEGEGKSDGEEPEVEEADGEEEGTTTEGGDETATEEGEGGGEEEEEEEGDEGEEEEEGGESSEEEEEGSDEESDEEGGGEAKAPEGQMPSVATVPGYPVPYPNMVETPVVVVPAGGYPVGTIPGRYPVATVPTGSIPMYTIPSRTVVGALVMGKSASDTKEENL